MWIAISMYCQIIENFHKCFRMPVEWLKDFEIDRNT